MKSLILLSIWILAVQVYCEQQKLVVHIAPHSHNDAGWLMPFEQYYQAYTKQILDKVVNYLSDHADRKFNWSDLAFFNRWWQDQTEEKKNQVKKLVNDKQFIFMGGGWVMNDEALPSYKEVLLQMRVGLDFLKQTFGIRPNIGWQIDPFGHSAVTPAVLHKLGYDGLVGNRISQDFKNKMSQGEGYNFIWEGHQVSAKKEESIIFTHIIQRHYNYPDTWSSSSFYMKDSKFYRNVVFDKEIIPTVNAIKGLSNNSDHINAYHVMIHAGDDFEFDDGARMFEKIDELNKELVIEGSRRGFDTITSYSSIHEYFEGIHSMNITYGMFKGDFLPFQEPFGQWEDFWTGYYSTRLHLKRLIRHTFNDIQSTKTLLTMRAIHKQSSNSIRFNDTLSSSIEAINSKIIDSERKWSIMMHHDAITGTHSITTETDYYNILSSSLKYLDEARDLIDKELRVPLSDRFIDKLKSFYSSFTSPEVIRTTILNPSGYFRIQIVNFTLPIDENKYFMFVEQNGDSVNILSNCEVANIYELDPNAKIFKTVKKGFCTIPMEALSEIQVYIFITHNSSDCSKQGITCAGANSTKSEVKNGVTMSNSVIDIQINSKGDLSKFIYSYGSTIEEFEETAFYYKSNSNTRSGAYLFNPRHNKTEIIYDNIQIVSINVGGLIQIVQVYKHNANDQILKTYIVNKTGCPNLMKQLFMEIQFISNRSIEVNLNIHKKSKGSNSQYKGYVDDSMFMVERPIFNSKVNVKRTNDFELNGYFTYPCVHGGVLRETYTNNNSNFESFFGWANSNPIACIFVGENQVEFMIYRSIGNVDYKGMNDIFIEKHVQSTSFQFYIDTNVAGVFFHKVRANTKLNEPYAKFEKSLNFESLNNLTQSTKLIPSLFNFQNYGNQLSSEFGEIDVADIKIEKHKLLENITTYEVALVLRNRFNGYVSINKNTISPNEGIFKNEYIDILKKNSDKTFMNNCNRDKILLKNDRYELKTLESEIHKVPQKNNSFHGLEPYELAEFRVVSSSILEALDIKKKQIAQENNKGSRALKCDTIDEVDVNPESQINETSHLLIFFSIIIALMMLLAILAFLIFRRYSSKKKYRQQINVTI